MQYDEYKIIYNKERNNQKIFCSTTSKLAEEVTQDDYKALPGPSTLENAGGELVAAKRSEVTVKVEMIWKEP